MYLMIIFDIWYSYCCTTNRTFVNIKWCNTNIREQVLADLTETIEQT